MSARPEIPDQDMITITVDGVAMQARKGAMLIEVTDAAGVHVPRFCYHKKLSVAANCRMCLVEVEKAPKPLPACATPVMDGMVVSTQSDYARAAQKAVMEFLLINHPLDCPICDQGGECELQDIALGYGRDVSRFAEKKRVVKDKNIGPLIATDMTRCIHCTRCVRFLEQIAGKRELGGTGRGENVEIGTYVERSIESEMSGNVIDVCPVGALTSKPFRFTARAWELNQKPSVAPHDALGSNLFVHSRRGQVMRVVPRENEEINEVWLSDRDRYSYEALNSGERLTRPMVKTQGQWQETDWETALKVAADGIRKTVEGHGADQLGMLASPTSTLEELFLFNRIASTLGCGNIDHRLRRGDFTGQDSAPLFPSLGQAIADLEALDAALVIGSNIRKDQPIAGHRLRKAAMKGAQVMFINAMDYEFLFPVAHKCIAAPSAMLGELAAVASALLSITGGSAPDALRGLLDAAEVTDTHRAIADALKQGERATVLLGSGASAHPVFASLRSLASLVASLSASTLGYLPAAANSVGACLAGVLPYRGAAGEARARVGLDARAMLDTPRKAYVLLGVEPEFDCFDACAAGKAMQAAEFVVSLGMFANAAAKEFADVLLPLAAFTETSGTYVNAEGRWQSVSGVVSAPGEARPGWKVLRVLANLLDVADCEYASSEQLRDELRGLVGERQAEQSGGEMVLSPTFSAKLERVGDVPIYAVDSLTRRAPALQKTADAADAVVRINAAQAEACGLSGAQQVRVSQGDCTAVLPLMIDERAPAGVAWIPAACPSSTTLGPACGAVELEKA